MRIRRGTSPEVAERDRVKEYRLVHAEHRAESLFQKAVQLKTIVSRRDQENHWQASVNRLFSGGKP